ncbi:MAG: TetR/AcrR family transcriptional regulator, partial [Micromonosporaceae bacterium]
PSRPESGDSPLAASRRERLLAEASRLFRKRGYHAVTMEDIGAAAGIAGPSVYRHFASKSDLLRSASTRMADRLSHDAARATAGAASATESLDRLVDCYAEAIWDNRDLITVYLNELAGLPEAQRAQLRRLQRGYVTEWVRLMRAARPGLTTAEARVVVQAALTVANDLARTGRTRGRPHLAQEIASLMRAVTQASCLPAGESGEEA